MNQEISHPPSAQAPAPVPANSGKASTASQGSSQPPALERLEQGAHQAISQLADGAAAQAERMHSGLSRASENMQQKAQQLREAKEEWTECLRIAVRDNPLAAVATALAIGMLIVRLGR